MSDSEASDTEALRAQRSAQHEGWVRDLCDRAETIRGLGRDLAQALAERETYQQSWRGSLSARNTLRAEVERLTQRAEAAERAIADAPHAVTCAQMQAEHVGNSAECTCWKAEYARASQPVPTEGDTK